MAVAATAEEGPWPLSLWAPTCPAARLRARFGAAEARRLLGPDALLGRSVHSPAAAADAEREGADYFLFGRPGRPQATPAGRPPAGRAGSGGAGCLDPCDRDRRHWLPECLAAGAGGHAARSGPSDGDLHPGERPAGSAGGQGRSWPIWTGSGPTRGRLRSSSTGGSSSATSTPHAQIADGSVIEVVRMVGGTTANSSNG
jgi:hypothetical protein